MTEQQPPQPDPQQPPYGQVPPPPPPSYQQPGYSQPGYAQPGYPQPGYGAPGVGQPAYYAPPAHPSSTTALVLGILGLVFCPLVLSIPAWVIGSRAVREIDASGGQLGGRGNAKAGYVLGIIGTAWGAISLLILVALFAIGGTVSSSFDENCTNVDNGTFSSC